MQVHWNLNSTQLEGIQILLLNLNFTIKKTTVQKFTLQNLLFTIIVKDQPNQKQQIYCMEIYY